ncbi:DUF4153 domain-containing protein [Actinoplanes nipponensis]|nr:DUF4173 domain-containing protein [Actinoplanes nipponensis]
MDPARLPHQAAPEARTQVSTQPTPAHLPPAPLHGPWADMRVFGNRWPGPPRPASRATIAAVLVAAVVAALSVPLDRAGVGWLITAIAGVVALAVARLVPDPAPAAVPPPLVRRPSGPEALSKFRYFWAAATVALLGVGTVRAAGWLFFLCLCTAVLTAALAVAGGRSLRAMTVAVFLAPVATLRALPWIARGVAAARRGGGGRGLRVAATVAVSALLLLVFGALFSSADAAFAGLVGRAVPDVDAGTVTRWIFVFGVASLVLGGAAYLRAAPPDLTVLERPGRRRVARLEWAVPLTLLVLLFAVFVAVQLTVLFGGSAHVLDTEGLTYAEYARSGFWQLLVVTGLTLGVLAGAARWAPRETGADRVLIRTVLGALAALTLVVVASATHRMDVYADTYGLTRLRLLVMICELWLGLVYVLILAAGLRLTGRWLPRAAVATAVLALLGLAGANPDRLIADHNVTRYEQTQRIDTLYLSELSADAVPALDRLSGVNRDCSLAPIAAGLRSDPDDWRGGNLGRHRARELLAHHPAPAPATCPGDYRYR